MSLEKELGRLREIAGSSRSDESGGQLREVIAALSAYFETLTSNHQMLLSQMHDEIRALHDLLALTRHPEPGSIEAGLRSRLEFESSIRRRLEHDDPCRVLCVEAPDLVAGGSESVRESFLRDILAPLGAEDRAVFWKKDLVLGLWSDRTLAMFGGHPLRALPLKVAITPDFEFPAQTRAWEVASHSGDSWDKFLRRILRSAGPFGDRGNEGLSLPDSKRPRYA